MSVAQPSEPKKKMSTPMRVATILVGLAAVVAGGLQIQRGMREVKDASASSEDQKLLVDSDQQMQAATKLLVDLVQKFQDLMTSVDKDGLDAVRKNKADAAQQIASQFGDGAAKFRKAADELDSFRTARARQTGRLPDRKSQDLSPRRASCRSEPEDHRLGARQVPRHDRRVARQNQSARCPTGCRTEVGDGIFGESRRVGQARSGEQVSWYAIVDRDWALSPFSGIQAP